MSVPGSPARQQRGPWHGHVANPCSQTPRRGTGRLFRRSGRALATPAPALRVDGSASHTGERFFALEDLLPIDDHEEHDPTWHATVIGLRSVTFTDGNGLRWKRTYAGPGQFGASRDARACSDRPSSVHAARVTSWR